MINGAYRTFQRLAFSPSPVLRAGVLTLVAAFGALVLALLIGVAGPFVALAFGFAIIAGALIIVDTHWGFVALVGVAFVLPFASLPFSIGFKPTFLDLALGALFFVWIAKIAVGNERGFIASPLGLLVALFMVMALFSFVFGLTHSRVSSFAVRRFAEILLGIALFFVAVNSVRSEGEMVWVVRWLMVAGWLSALIAVAFYVIPTEWTVAILNRLARFDYPGGYEALRWIEDDPAGTMRAIGTAVDPNVLGGMMILVTALLAPQLFTCDRLLPRWLAWFMFATAAIALYLTYSRSALLGMTAAIGLIGVLKYRRLLILGLVAGFMLLLLPQTQAYIARLVAGFAGADLATQMRFGEYKDAIALVQRYPLFGVGFVSAPDIDLYLGVSMLYLIIAENMGLVGLLLFVALMVWFFMLMFRSWRRGFGPRLEPIVLGLTGGVLGALVSGVFDHYWFNMTYPHMTVLLWLYIGLAIAAVLIQEGVSTAETRVRAQGN
jgi:polysaccharide biosynthesis protein PslJ